MYIGIQLNLLQRYPNGILRNQMCAGDMVEDGDGTSKDTCGGDSGGKIMSINKLKPRVHICF